ncbi:hypothetical protein HK405_006698 [Cladochytrium tenue]|nr:hypothetical protein HK405_006698 [Cladochytrium tenue]
MAETTTMTSANASAARPGAGEPAAGASPIVDLATLVTADAAAAPPRSASPTPAAALIVEEADNGTGAASGASNVTKEVTFAGGFLTATADDADAEDNGKPRSSDHGAPPELDPDFIRVRLDTAPFILVLMALVLAVTLPALDQSIVSTALNTMVADLGDEALVSWVGAAYQLTSAISALVFGKISDIFGRKWSFMVVVFLFALGSAVSAAGTSMVHMIIGRAVAGLGGGGVIAGVFVIMSDMVTMRDRGRYQGIVGGVFSVASVVGPLVGGAFSDAGIWRWCFYINLPIGAAVLCCVLVFLKFPHTEGSTWEKLAKVDYLGILLIVACVVCFLTPLQLGGSKWPWASPQVIIMFILSVLSLAAFVYVENKVAKVPIVPPSVYMNWSVVALHAMAFGAGSTQIAIVYYIGIFYQVDFGLSASQAGVSCIPLVLTSGIMTFMTGQIITWTGHYNFMAYVAGFGGTAGLIAISFLNPDSSVAERVLFLMLLGITTGGVFQVRTVGVQASVDLDHIAVATSISQFLVVLGGGFSIAVAGTILNNELVREIYTHPALASMLSEPQFSSIDPTDVVSLRQKLASSAIQSMYPQAAEALQDLLGSFTGAFSLAVRFLIVFSSILIISPFFVKEYGVHRRPSVRHHEEVGLV